MELADFTTYDEVRAMLGVSDEDISNTTLALPVYLLSLQLDLETEYEDLVSTYLAYKAFPTPTANEQKLVNLVQVFSAYATSKSLLASSTLFAPKQITDGRASLTRFDATSDLRDDIDKALVAIRRRLKLLLITLGLLPAEVSTNRNYFGVAGLAVDPITNLR